MSGESLPRLSGSSLFSRMSLAPVPWSMLTSLERKQLVEQNVPGVGTLIHQIQLRDHGDCPVTCTNVQTCNTSDIANSSTTIRAKMVFGLNNQTAVNGFWPKLLNV